MHTLFAMQRQQCLRREAAEATIAWSRLHEDSSVVDSLTTNERVCDLKVFLARLYKSLQSSAALLWAVSSDVTVSCFISQSDINLLQLLLVDGSRLNAC